MNDTNIISQEDLTNFLADGAFLRDGAQIHVFVGPFKPAKDPSNAIGLSAPLFYEGDKLQVLEAARALTLPKVDCVRWLQRHMEVQPAAAKTPISWKSPLLTDYEKAFSIVQNMIVQGQIDKAVPVVFETADFEVKSAQKLEWMLQALLAPDNLIPFGWWQGAQGFIATTPEVLFDIQGRTLNTMALAGTMARHEGSAQDLLRSEKNNKEHQFVVDDICAQLKNFGTVQKSPKEILELPTLRHIQTKISCELDERPDYQRLLAHLHPTPALGVAPRVFGWRWMMELPGQKNRLRFGAPFTFFVSKERVLSILAIRGLQWKDRELAIGSGGGLVKDSQLSNEWDELTNKRESVKKIFGLTPSGTH